MSCREHASFLRPAGGLTAARHLAGSCLAGLRSAWAVLALGVAVSGLAGAAPAEGVREGVRSEQAIAGASAMRWLAPEPTSKPSRSSKSGRKAAALALDRRLGRGSHICSASGFGQRPRCVAR